MTPPLYATEAELARWIMGDRAKAWPAKAKHYEDKYPDFPKVDVLMGGRYSPAVKLWFDRHNGIALQREAPPGREPRVRIVTPKPDGVENFGATPSAKK